MQMRRVSFNNRMDPCLCPHLHTPAAGGGQCGGVDGQRLLKHSCRHRRAKLAGNQGLAVAKVGAQERLQRGSESIRQWERPSTHGHGLLSHNW